MKNAVFSQVSLAVAVCFVAGELFAAAEWIESQDWTGKEMPCAVQVALKGIGI